MTEILTGTHLSRGQVRLPSKTVRATTLDGWAYLQGKVDGAIDAARMRGRIESIKVTDAELRRPVVWAKARGGGLVGAGEYASTFTANFPEEFQGRPILDVVDAERPVFGNLASTRTRRSSVPSRSGARRARPEYRRPRATYGRTSSST